MIKIQVDWSIKQCNNRFLDFSEGIKGVRHTQKTFCFKRSLINAENISYKLFRFVINYSNLLKINSIWHGTLELKYASPWMFQCIV